MGAQHDSYNFTVDSFKAQSKLQFHAMPHRGVVMVFLPCYASICCSSRFISHMQLKFQLIQL